MDVVQWIARRPGDPAVVVRFVPTEVAQIEAAAGWPPLRRRGAALASPHLQRPLVAAVPAGVVDDLRLARTGLAPPVPVMLQIMLSAGDEAVFAGTDDVRFASVFGEFVGVVADLVDAAGLPLLTAHPAAQARALVVALGDVAGLGRSRLADALVVLAVAVRMAALARGFDATLSLVGHPGPEASLVVDGRIEEQL
jgi:hypothetical protein